MKDKLTEHFLIIAKIRLMRTIRNSFSNTYTFRKSPMFEVYSALRCQLIFDHHKNFDIKHTKNG